MAYIIMTREEFESLLNDAYGKFNMYPRPDYEFDGIKLRFFPSFKTVEIWKDGVKWSIYGIRYLY